MKITKEWGIKVGVTALAVLWLGLVAASWADASEQAGDTGAAKNASDPITGNAPGDTTSGNDRSPASASARVPASGASSSNSDDEYNFNWLDPEKKIYVLQNRRYLKANRLMLSGMVGTGFSNPYRTSYNLDPRIAYYFSEQFGVEVFYTFTVNSANSTFNALAGTNANVLPVIREITGQYGASFHWVPWYAKINVFNKILYFDWYFSAGLGDVHANASNTSDGTSAPNKTAVPQDYFAMFFGTGHIYHITDSLLVRLDFTSAVYNAQIYGTGGGGTWYSNLNFGAGVGWRL